MGAEVAEPKAAEDIALDVLRGYSNKNILRPFEYVKENDLDNILSRSFSFMKHLIKRRQLTRSTQI